MNNYSEYASILNCNANKNFIFYLILLIISIGVIIWCYHDIKVKDIDNIDKIIILLLILLWTTGLISEYVLYRIDMKNENYITYTGEFYVEEVTGSGSYHILIKKENDNKSKNYDIHIHKIYDDANVKNGNIYQYIEEDTSYKGTFVYSKYSKVLVDIYVEAKIE